MDRARLERWLVRPAIRRTALRIVFAYMPRVLSRRRIEKEGTVVVEWRITGRPDGQIDLRQLVIDDGTAVVVPGDPLEEDLAVTVDLVDVLLLGTGNANGAAMFMKGDISIDGDPWLAMRLPQLFGFKPPGGPGRKSAGSA